MNMTWNHHEKSLCLEHPHGPIYPVVLKRGQKIPSRLMIFPAFEAPFSAGIPQPATVDYWRVVPILSNVLNDIPCFPVIQALLLVGTPCSTVKATIYHVTCLLDTAIFLLVRVKPLFFLIDPLFVGYIILSCSLLNHHEFRPTHHFLGTKTLTHGPQEKSWPLWPARGMKRPWPPTPSRRWLPPHGPRWSWPGRSCAWRWGEHRVTCWFTSRWTVVYGI
jgi:hypothetical protein